MPVNFVPLGPLALFPVERREGLEVLAREVPVAITGRPRLSSNWNLVWLSLVPRCAQDLVQHLLHPAIHGLHDGLKHASLVLLLLRLLLKILRKRLGDHRPHGGHRLRIHRHGSTSGWSRFNRAALP